MRDVRSKRERGASGAHRTVAPAGSAAVPRSVSVSHSGVSSSTRDGHCDAAQDAR